MRKQYPKMKSGLHLDLLFDKAQPIFLFQLTQKSTPWSSSSPPPPLSPCSCRLSLTSLHCEHDLSKCYNLSTYQSLVTITTKSKTNLDLKLNHRPIIGHQYVKVLLLLLTLVHLLAPASPSSLFHLSVGEIDLARLCGNVVGKDAISRNM